MCSIYDLATCIVAYARHLDSLLLKKIEMLQVLRGKAVLCVLFKIVLILVNIINLVFDHSLSEKVVNFRQELQDEENMSKNIKSKCGHNR